MSTAIKLPTSLSEQQVDEVKHDLAVVLFMRRAISLAQAARIAELTEPEFERMLVLRRLQLSSNHATSHVNAGRDTMQQHSPVQPIDEHFDNLIARMVVQNAQYSDEEVAADIEAARAHIPRGTRVSNHHSK